MCTESKTFALSSVEASNCVLLSRVVGSEQVKVCGMLGAHHELSVAPPRLDVLHEILLATAYTREEMDEALEGQGEASATGGTPMKRPRGGAELPLTPLLKMVRSPAGYHRIGYSGQG